MLCQCKCVCVPWWHQLLLQELLYLVHIDLDLAVEGHEWRVCPWSEVLQVSWLPDNNTPNMTAHVAVVHEMTI